MARSSRSSRPFGPTTVAFACPSGQLSLAKGPPAARGAQASDGSSAAKASATRATGAEPARAVATASVR